MSKRTRSYVEKAFNEIQAQNEVRDILIINSSGDPIKTTLSYDDGLKYAVLLDDLLRKAILVIHDIDPKDDVLILRVRTRDHEILVTPDGKITFIVVQNSVDQMSKKVTKIEKL